MGGQASREAAYGRYDDDDGEDNEGISVSVDGPAAANVRATSHATRHVAAPFGMRRAGQRRDEGAAPFYIVVTGNAGCTPRPFLNALAARLGARVYAPTNDEARQLGPDSHSVNMLDRFKRGRENPFALQSASFFARLRTIKQIVREPQARINILFRSPWDEMLAFLPALVQLGALNSSENYTLQLIYSEMQTLLYSLLPSTHTLHVYLKIPLEACVRANGGDGASCYWNATTLRALEEAYDRWMLSSDFRQLYRIEVVQPHEWPASPAELEHMAESVYAALLPPHLERDYRIALRRAAIALQAARDTDANEDEDDDNCNTDNGHANINNSSNSNTASDTDSGERKTASDAAAPVARTAKTRRGATLDAIAEYDVGTDDDDGDGDDARDDAVPPPLRASVERARHFSTTVATALRHT